MGYFLAQVYQNLTTQAYFWLSRGNHDYAILFLLSYMPFLRDNNYKDYTFHKVTSLPISQKQELFFKLLTAIHAKLIDIMSSLSLKEIQIENTYTDISMPATNEKRNKGRGKGVKSDDFSLGLDLGLNTNNEVES